MKAPDSHTVPVQRFLFATAVILAAAFWATHDARAAAVPAAASRAAPACSHRTLELKLDASFSLDGAPMQIRVTGSKAKVPTLATLFAKGQCQAVCEVTNFEQETGNPLSLELSCRSVGLAPLAVTATLFWPEALGQKTPTLRFGTWLTGYRKAPLKVRFDALRNLDATKAQPARSRS